MTSLGQMLLQEGKITALQLDRAETIRRSAPDRSMVEIFTGPGFLTRQELGQVLEMQLGIPYVDLEDRDIPAASASLLPPELAKKHRMVPVFGDDRTLHLAMADPLDYRATEAAAQAARRQVVPLLAEPDAIDRVLSLLYGSASADRALEELKTAPVLQEPSPEEADGDADAPVIRLVNGFLEYALEQGASDIHFEPRQGDMAVRMRLDGQLRQMFTLPRANQNAVIARIKVMGTMDLAEHRLPLDGRCTIRLGGKEVDLRISTLPTVHGEKAVIRLLHRSDSLLTPEGIGLRGENIATYYSLLENTNGVILLVGPTGSGKSSTMYTMLGFLNREQVNLVTLEDPVEYRLDVINQVQINEKTGMTFASGLRAILRQDPDIIALGEIRDQETADIAMRSAITGHLVLSTLHTNDAPGAIDRLLDMGVEHYLIASGLKGVISQRLVRKICPHCRESYHPSAEELNKLQLPDTPGRVFYRGRGCRRCFQTGYRGRTAVFEFLTVTPELRRAIADGASRNRILAISQQEGFRPLRLDCLELVEEGITTAEEAILAIRSTQT